MIITAGGVIISDLSFTVAPGGDAFATVRADASGFARTLSATDPGGGVSFFARLNETDDFQNIISDPLTVPASGGQTVLYLKISADGGAAFGSIICELFLI